MVNSFGAEVAFVCSNTKTTGGGSEQRDSLQSPHTQPHGNFPSGLSLPAVVLGRPWDEYSSWKTRGEGAFWKPQREVVLGRPRGGSFGKTHGEVDLEDPGGKMVLEDPGEKAVPGRPRGKVVSGRPMGKDGPGKTQVEGGLGKIQGEGGPGKTQRVRWCRKTRV